MTEEKNEVMGITADQLAQEKEQRTEENMAPRKRKLYAISTPLNEKEYYDVESYCFQRKLRKADLVRILLTNAGILEERKAETK